MLTAPDGTTPDDTANRFARVSREDPSHPSRGDVWAGPYRGRWLFCPSPRVLLIGAMLLITLALLLVIWP